MKLMISAIGMLLLCLNLNAQSLNQIFEKYAEGENAVHINISKNFINMVSNGENSNEAMKHIKSLEVIVLDEGNQIGGQEYDKLFNSLKKFDLEELIQVRSKDGDFDFMYNEADGFINNLIMIGRSEDSSFLMRLDGKILKKHLDDIDIDIDGANHLKLF